MPLQKGAEERREGVRREEKIRERETESVSNRNSQKRGAE